MGLRTTAGPYTLFDAQATTGTADPFLVSDFRNAIFSFATDGGGDAALTVKFQGSIQDTKPDFSAARSVTNMWDYIEIIDLESGDAIDGDTGLAVATADDYRLVEANINALKWMSATVTARTEGEVTVITSLFDNS